jgi:hypothetical protein
VTEVIKVNLTERQAEVADWLLGCPSMCEWFMESHNGGFDFSYLQEPELDGKTLKLEIDGELLDNIIDELDRYSQEARYSLGSRKGSAEERVANNLLEKITEACSPEVIEACEEIRSERARKIQEANNQ